MSDDLSRAIAEALGCEKHSPDVGYYCRTHAMPWGICKRKSERVAAALAPVIEAREARAVVHELSAVCAWLITDPRPSSPVDIFDHIRALATVHYEVSDPDRFRDLRECCAHPKCPGGSLCCCEGGR